MTNKDLKNQANEILKIIDEQEKKISEQLAKLQLYKLLVETTLIKKGVK